MKWPQLSPRPMQKRMADPKKVIIKPLAPPLKLSNRLSEKKGETIASNCLQEMLSVITCLKDNEYDNKLCPKELQLFQKCIESYKIQQTTFKENERKGILAPYAKNITARQVNKYLKHYPHV